MNRVKNWVIGIAIIDILFLSGCATVQLMNKSFLKFPPSVIVIGDIASANGKVSLPLERIEEGREIVFETFKKELPEFYVLKSAKDIPLELENYLLVETKIMYYRESRPYLVATIAFATGAASAMTAEMTVTKYKEKVIILKFPANSVAGPLMGKSGAYTEGLRSMAKRIAKTIKRCGGE